MHVYIYLFVLLQASSMLCFQLECVIFKRQIFSNIIYLTALKISDRNKPEPELCSAELFRLGVASFQMSVYLKEAENALNTA